MTLCSWYTCLFLLGLRWRKSVLSSPISYLLVYYMFQLQPVDQLYLTFRLQNMLYLSWNHDFIIGVVVNTSLLYVSVHIFNVFHIHFSMLQVKSLKLPSCCSIVNHKLNIRIWDGHKYSTPYIIVLLVPILLVSSMKSFAETIPYKHIESVKVIICTVEFFNGFRS